MHKKNKFISIFLVLFSIVPFPVSASLVSNGSFESPIAPSGGFQVFTSIPGWTKNGGDNDFELWNGIFGYTSADGLQHIELDSIDMQQILTTIPGGTYSLKFAYAPRPDVVDNHFQVFLDNTLLTDINVSGTGKTNLDWTYGSFIFDATSSSTTLRFVGLASNPKLGMLVDDISVTAVPAPASLWLFLCGLIGFIVRLKSKC